MKKGHENKKTISRTGLGGGRVGNAPIHNRPKPHAGTVPNPPPAQPAAQPASAQPSPAQPTAALQADIHEDPDETTAGKLLHDDTVGVLFTVGGLPTFVVCEVAQMKSSAGHTLQSGAVRGLPVSELEGIRTTITVRPLVSSCSVTSPSTLVFSGESSVAEQTVFGPFVQPLTLTAGAHSGQTALSMESHLLNDAGIIIWLRVTANDNELFEHIKSAPSGIVHNDASRDAMFVLGGGSASFREQVRVGSRADRLCGIGGCATKLSNLLSSEKVSHASFYAACTAGQMQHTEMCYLCYGPASACPVYLIKTSGAVLQPRVLCKATDPSASETDIQRSGVKMQMARISKSTQD